MARLYRPDQAVQHMCGERLIYCMDQVATLPNNLRSDLEKVITQFCSLSLGGGKVIDANCVCPLISSNDSQTTSAPPPSVTTSLSSAPNLTQQNQP
jgi:hypothetical protein